MRYKLVQPSNQARPGAPLAPILGQINVKVQDFIQEFHQQSAPYQDGLPLPCRITKLSSSGKFSLKVLPPGWFQLVWGQHHHHKIELTQFYDCFIFRYQRVPTPLEVRTVLGQLRGSKLKIRTPFN